VTSAIIIDGIIIYFTAELVWGTLVRIAIGFERTLLTRMTVPYALNVFLAYAFHERVEVVRFP
jgi:hypothetical protein